MDGFDKFDSDFLCRNGWYNSLHNPNINGSEYSHALKIWKNFDMKNMGDYHDLYLQFDIS